MNNQFLTQNIVIQIYMVWYNVSSCYNLLGLFCIQISSKCCFHYLSFWRISLFNEMLLWAKHINGTGFLAFVACQRQLTALLGTCCCWYIQCLKSRQSLTLNSFDMKSMRKISFASLRYHWILIRHFAIMFCTKTEVDDSLDFKHCMLIKR